MAWLAEPWGLALAVLGVLALLALLAWIYLWLTVRRLSRPTDYASMEVVTAPDGGRFELRRVAIPPGAHQADSTPVPVLLVHGICANHRNLDLQADSSLARFLVQRGRDVWLLTLRSGRPWRLREACLPQGFERMARHDVPLGIRRVLQCTGASALDYVGFSMGGMLLYAALGRWVPAGAIRRCVLIGSPARVQPPRGVPRWLRFAPPWLVPRVLTGTLGTFCAACSEWFTTPVHRAIINPANMAPGMTRLALVDCVADVSGPLLGEFMRWATTDGVVRVAGEDVVEGLRAATVPALFVAGQADQVGTVESVRVAYAAWGGGAAGVEKRWLELGEPSGAAAPYGHGDLAVGARLRVDLFPRIDEFLAVAPGPASEEPAAGDEG